MTQDDRVRATLRDSNDPYFTVIIPTYGRPLMLQEAVASVIAQTFQDWELIIVDDASPVRLPLFAEKRVRVIRNEINLGKSASVNRALDDAKGEVVAFLDDDDAWTPLRLAHAHDAHVRGSDVVVCKSTEMGATGPAIKGGKARRLLGGASSRWMNPSYDAGGISNMGSDSVKRELCPRFDESFVACEDSDWALRLWQQARAVTISDHQDHIWRKHLGYRHNNGVRARVEGTEMLLAKHADYYARNHREKSFRLYRLALLYRSLGDAKNTRKYALASLRAFPNLRAARWLLSPVPLYQI